MECQLHPNDVKDLSKLSRYRQGNRGPERGRGGPKVTL